MKELRIPQDAIPMPWYLRAIRKYFGLTVEQVAMKLNVSSGTVYRWETGKTKPTGLAKRNLNKWLLSKKVRSVKLSPPEEGVCVGGFLE